MSARWCTVHVDTADEQVVAALVTGLLGPGSALAVFAVPGFTVEVCRNPDRTRSPHPLDWPTLIEVDGLPGTTGEDLADFVGRLRTHLHTAGLRTEPRSG